MIGLWRTYLPWLSGERFDSSMGLRILEFQAYRLSNPSRPVTIRSMLTAYELALLYSLAKDYYTGTGRLSMEARCLERLRSIREVPILYYPRSIEEGKKIRPRCLDRTLDPSEVQIH